MCERMQQQQNSEGRTGPGLYRASNSFLTRGRGEGGWGKLLFNGYRFYVRDDEKVWGIFSADGYVTL